MPIFGGLGASGCVVHPASTSKPGKTLVSSLLLFKSIIPAGYPDFPSISMFYVLISIL